jgi:hypothetical protein
MNPQGSWPLGGKGTVVGGGAASSAFAAQEGRA